MPKNNVNARELLEAIIIAEEEGWDWKIPSLLEYAGQHPTQFIKSVKSHSKSKRLVNVIMTHHGPKKISAIKLVSRMTGLGLYDAKMAVESNTFKMSDKSGSESMQEYTAQELIKAMEHQWSTIPGCNDQEFPTFEIVPVK